MKLSWKSVNFCFFIFIIQSNIVPLQNSFTHFFMSIFENTMLSNEFLILVAALLPVLIALYFINRKDKNNPEPTGQGEDFDYSDFEVEEPQG